MAEVLQLRGIPLLRSERLLRGIFDRGETTAEGRVETLTCVVCHHHAVSKSRLHLPTLFGCRAWVGLGRRWLECSAITC